MSEPNNTALLQQKRAERDAAANADSPAEAREMVMHGAKLQCPYAQGPGELAVTSNELKLQDQLWATEGDGNNMVNLQFKGTCGHPKWPQRKMTPPPCMSVIKLTPWENVGTTIIQEQKALIKGATIKCNPEFNVAQAGPIPNTPSIASANLTVPAVINAYFALLETGKTGSKEVEVEVTNKKTKKKQKQKKTIETKELIIKKVTERGLSYQAVIVVETALLQGKKIKVQVKSAPSAVLSENDKVLALLDVEEIEAISDPGTQATVKPKDIFEVEVGKFGKSSNIENPDDFKDKAILKLMLNGKPDDLSFDWAEKIMASADKKAELYLEITCDEPNVLWSGAGENKNLFLNSAGQYFELKYLEQPWIVKAREEQKKNISEATHCTRISGTYHAVNRQHKPTGCATITNAWCASFVGWCLTAASYSAQLDPGAYSYAEVNTRYREGFNGPDGKKVKAEFFGDPVWGAKTNANKKAVGAISVLTSGKHVTFCVAQTKSGGHVFGLGGNQGDAVKVSAYASIKSYVYPIEYAPTTIDYELPIYYRSTNSESTS